MVFDERAWDDAVKGVDVDDILPVKIAALEASLHLPPKPREEDFSSASWVFATLRASLNRLRERSLRPDLLPNGTKSDEELALWAIGLVQHVRRR